jgi:hypothetical protein
MMAESKQGGPQRDPLELPPARGVSEPMPAYHAPLHATAKTLLLAAFLRRYGGLLQRLGEAAPEQAISDALSASDDVGGLAALLARVGPLSPPPVDPLAPARARGAQFKGELLSRAGGALRLGEAARQLGVSSQAVHARRKRGTLLAVPQANGEWLYPLCQFGPDGALPGLGTVLQAFQVHGPWTQLAVLLSPFDALGGRTPLQALQAGQTELAAEAVSLFGEHGG